MIRKDQPRGELMMMEVSFMWGPAGLPAPPRPATACSLDVFSLPLAVFLLGERALRSARVGRRPAWSDGTAERTVGLARSLARLAAHSHRRDRTGHSPPEGRCFWPCRKSFENVGKPSAYTHRKKTLLSLHEMISRVKGKDKNLLFWHQELCIYASRIFEKIQRNYESTLGEQTKIFMRLPLSSLFFFRLIFTYIKLESRCGTVAFPLAR